MVADGGPAVDWTGPRDQRAAAGEQRQAGGERENAFHFGGSFPQESVTPRAG